MAGIEPDERLVAALQDAADDARGMGEHFQREWTVTSPIARDAVRAIAVLVGKLTELEYEALNVVPRRPVEVNQSC